ncbi:MAG: (d)CMP kinase [Oscillospiraceae bacterium]|jgi:cytidylate kinase|nr:(d)CMP kinase [Oscillibacter sp.]MDY4908097.1 (d)CMP kinase [Oscillospiraceae bacterium]MDY5018633.1 (d)CMP kinase [Oscillospiraceae bacterium]
MKEHFSIAIDGPGGAGKSSLAKAVAKKLSILHVDTGAIYRTIGYAAFARGLNAKDESQIAPLLKTIRIDMAFDEAGGQKMLLDGKDVSREIRLPEISMYASNVSALPCVRAYLLEMQRDIARKRSVIMDGRDIGTVVLPDADLKIYLTASAEERARRRCLELSERGTPEPYEAVLREINERDEQDMHRAIAPLREAADAVRLDTSALNFDESEQALLKLIQEKLQ